MSSPSKKRKHRDEDAVSAHKERKHKRKRNRDVDVSEFSLVQASLVVSIPPVFASNPAQGVEEMLDSMIMRYIPTLHGVVLAHSNLRFLQSTARIQGDSPFAVCTVGFAATVWSPRVGQRLTGTVNLCSPDHIALLVHRTFNVSVPRHHIPRAEWAFEHGPAENDPEYGAGAAVLEGDADAPAESEGRWVHVRTGAPLGGKSRGLEFTVVGMTIANQMLSLIGSIQPDPFSPAHAAPAHVASAQPPAPAPPPAEDAPPAPEDDSASEPDFDVDIFAELGRSTAQMLAAAASKEGGEKKRKKEKGKREGGERKRKKKAAEAEMEPKKRKKKKKKQDG